MIREYSPPLSGNIDIVIKANGDWYHEGVKFLRQPLVKLFASILKKEGDDYFLVSPVEKWKVVVEDVPLLVTEVFFIEDHINAGRVNVQFKTATDDVFFLDREHPLRLSRRVQGAELQPYVMVRDDLEALLHRNVFYYLAENAVVHNGKHGIWSCGDFFQLEK